LDDWGKGPTEKDTPRVIEKYNAGETVEKMHILQGRCKRGERKKARP